MHYILWGCFLPPLWSHRAATSEFDEDIEQSKQMGFNIDNDADSEDENSDNNESNRKVCTFSLLIIPIQDVYCHQLIH